MRKSDSSLGSRGLPIWVENAAKLPLAFAQVREDALVDLSVLDQLGKDARVLMVASGGCTAAALVSSGHVAYLQLVDMSPAQIALSRLKLRLLETTKPQDRLRILGHAPMQIPQRRAYLATALEALEVPTDILGPLDLVAEIGPDHAGRYERLFAELRHELKDEREPLLDLLSLRDPVEQSKRVHTKTKMGEALDQAFEKVMALPNLIRLFGEGATRNRVEPFARHFAKRTRHILATMSADGNPWLAQMLLGRFSDGAVYPWLSAPIPRRMPTISWIEASMVKPLEQTHEGFDFVHLSNILDWLTPEEARRTLHLTWRALRKSGRVILRQLNSTLDIPAMGPEFQWDIRMSQLLHRRDRSFFYRGIYVGAKH